MLITYTARYIQTESGYTASLLEWPEVAGEGNTLDECREALQQAMNEMVETWNRDGKEIPSGGALLEWISIDI